jgi:hypothetical protein
VVFVISRRKDAAALCGVNRNGMRLVVVTALLIGRNFAIAIRCNL